MKKFDGLMFSEALSKRRDTPHTQRKPTQRRTRPALPYSAPATIPPGKRNPAIMAFPVKYLNLGSLHSFLEKPVEHPLSSEVEVRGMSVNEIQSLVFAEIWERGHCYTSCGEIRFGRSCSGFCVQEFT
jgi:hypothetical protein